MSVLANQFVTQLGRLWPATAANRNTTISRLNDEWVVGVGGKQFAKEVCKEGIVMDGMVLRPCCADLWFAVCSFHFDASRHFS